MRLKMDLREFNSLLKEESFSTVKATGIHKQIKSCINDVYQAYTKENDDYLLGEFMKKFSDTIKEKKLSREDVRQEASEYLSKLRDKE